MLLCYIGAKCVAVPLLCIQQQKLIRLVELKQVQYFVVLVLLHLALLAKAYQRLIWNDELLLNLSLG